MNKELAIKEMDSLVGFYEDMHSCEEDNILELPNNAGWGCQHMLQAEKAFAYIAENLK